MVKIWTSEEQNLVDLVMRNLMEKGMKKEAGELENCLRAMEYQTESLALYPSILERHTIGDRERDVETLIATLGDKYKEEDVFVTPSKAIFGRGLEFGKINALYMVRYLARAVNVELGGNSGIHDHIMKRILTVMMEDVLMELLNEPALKIVRMAAARALVCLWENRLSPDTIPFGCALANMWMVRRESLPIFGSLLGTHEYVSLYRRADEESRAYIQYAAEFPDETSSLEEFLFGLSFEELCIVKEEMTRKNKSCLGHDEVAGILSRESIFLSGKTEDPLELYRFFNYRKKSAMVRRFSRSRGPIRTFEENFMTYLLLRSEMRHEISGLLEKEKE